MNTAVEHLPVAPPVEIVEGPLSYRILPESEWDKLDTVRDKMPGPLPSNPLSSQCVVAENDQGRIVGILFMQMQWHMEPIHIDTNYRGKVNFPRLVNTLLEDAPAGFHYWVFSTAKRIGQMFKHVGMKCERGYVVWRGEK